MIAMRPAARRRFSRAPTVRPRRRRLLRRLLLLACLAWGAWTACMAVVIWRHGARDGARAADCIIVLGAAAYGVKPSPVLEERVQHALTLYRRGLAPRLLFTGGYGRGASHAESTVAAAFAEAAGVPAADVLTETASRTTRQNLVEAQALMRRAGLVRAIIVSDPLHLWRAAQLAEDLGIEAVTSPTPTSKYRSHRSRLRFLVRELGFAHADLLHDLRMGLRDAGRWVAARRR